MFIIISEAFMIQNMFFPVPDVFAEFFEDILEYNSVWGLIFTIFFLMLSRVSLWRLLFMRRVWQNKKQREDAKSSPASPIREPASFHDYVSLLFS